MKYLAFLLVIACDPAVKELPPDAGETAEVDSSPVLTNLQRITFTESTADILNPERGFYKTFDLTGANVLSAAQNVRAAGYSIAWVKINLQPYINSSIPQTFLDQLGRGFNAARQAGIKLIVRPVYNDDSGEPDAPLARILEHIEELTPVLNANRDVIMLWQAGFIGAWGEWHGSTSGNNTTEIRAEILEAMLRALPLRYVDLRTPMFKSSIYADADPLTDALAHKGLRGRTGHYNDCFLASVDDYGTYDDPSWMDWIAQDSKYTSMGGETCNHFEPRSKCSNALPEMAAHHWTYINSEYNQTVLNQWKSQGCFAEINQRLGYRLVAHSLAYTSNVVPNGILHVELEVENVGFAAPVNRRPVYLVLTKGTSRRILPFKVDIRKWYAGESQLLIRDFLLPTLSKGAWSISLWLPDREATIKQDSRYAILLANQGITFGAKGENILNATLTVE